MKNRTPITLQSISQTCTAKLLVRLNVLLAVTLLNVACGTSDPMSSPSLSSAEPAATPENPFSPVSSGDNTTPTPATDSEQAQGENSEGEPMGTALPGLPAAEPIVEPASTETPEVAVVSHASCTATDSDMQQRMLQLINEARATERTCGDESYSATRALLWNTLLVDAASVHSEDMATHNFFSHTGSDGSQASTRVTSAGYQWRTVGENIAAGRDNAADTVDDWLESPGHCRNIMNPSFTEVAVTCAEENDSDYERYWTNVLAAPR